MRCAKIILCFLGLLGGLCVRAPAQRIPSRSPARGERIVITASAVLDGRGRVLRDTRIVVEGHTDSIGTAEYNRALGGRRARAVRDYLVERGIAAERLAIVTHGEDSPEFDNGSSDTRRLNRRGASRTLQRRQTIRAAAAVRYRRGKFPGGVGRTS